jgi:hypothetical protein
LTVLAASETLSFVLAILGGSFRLLAKAVLPLVVVFILSACGGSSRETVAQGVQVRGKGYSFERPRGWEVERPADGIVARHGDELVSVTRFPLRKAYDPAHFDEVAKELDRLAGRLADRSGASLSAGDTVTVAGRKVRAYRYGDKRIGFVLEGTREYQLYCVRVEAACELLFSTFALDGPPS